MLKAFLNVLDIQVEMDRRLTGQRKQVDAYQHVQVHNTRMMLAVVISVCPHSHQHHEQKHHHRCRRRHHPNHHPGFSSPPSAESPLFSRQYQHSRRSNPKHKHMRVRIRSKQLVCKSFCSRKYTLTSASDGYQTLCSAWLSLCALDSHVRRYATAASVPPAIEPIWIRRKRLQAA